MCLKRVILGKPYTNELQKIEKFAEGAASKMYADRKDYFPILVKSFLIDFLSLTVIFLQWILMDYLTNFELSNGLADNFRNFSLMPEHRSDSLSLIFPVNTKCVVKTYGQGGGRVTADHHCILPQNDAFEKTYLLNWIWLSFVLTCQLTYIAYYFVTNLAIHFRQKTRQNRNQNEVHNT